MQLKPLVSLIGQPPLDNTNAPLAVLPPVYGPAQPLPANRGLSRPDGLTLNQAVLISSTLTTGTAVGMLGGGLLMPPSSAQLASSMSAVKIAAENNVYGAVIGGAATLTGGLVSLVVADNTSQGILAGAASGALAGALTAAHFTGKSASSLAFGIVLGAVGGAMGGGATGTIKQSLH